MTRRILVSLALSALVLLLVAVSSGSSAAPKAPVEVEFLAHAEPSPYPFSPAARIGNVLFLAGQLGSVRVDGARRSCPAASRPRPGRRWRTSAPFSSAPARRSTAWRSAR
jgi:hypothetical protein